VRCAASVIRLRTDQSLKMLSNHTSKAWAMVLTSMPPTPAIPTSASSVESRRKASSA